jgi:hypothetical protein
MTYFPGGEQNTFLLLPGGEWGGQTSGVEKSGNSFTQDNFSWRGTKQVFSEKVTRRPTHSRKEG